MTFNFSKRTKDGHVPGSDLIMAGLAFTMALAADLWTDPIQSARTMAERFASMMTPFA